MSGPTVEQIQAIPVAHSLASGKSYGSARTQVTSRAATLVRLVTSDGAVGWGECFGPPTAVAPLVEEIGNSLVGQSVDYIDPFIARMLQINYHLASAGLYVSALSGVNIALWDAWGHTLGVSISRLLGGRSRERVRAYASTGYVTADQSIEAYAEMLESAVTEGFSDAKIKLGLGLMQDRQRAEVARDYLGDDGYLMVDFNGNYTADTALRVIESLADIGIHWVEEPVPPEDWSGLRRVQEAGVPLAGGEALYTRFGFREIISRRLLDIIQPDVCKCGGFSEACAVANLARTWNIRLSPHTWGTAISLAASLQLLASLPDYPHPSHAPEPLWFEFDRGPNRLREELLTVRLSQQDGYVPIPDGPGLGIEINTDTVEDLRLDRGR